MLGCFASESWASQVASGRPYGDLDEMISVAEAAWAGLTPADWLVAMASHPKIGERGGHAPASSEREQSEVLGARRETLDALAAENRRYEDRFGHVFLIFASGRSAEEILASLRARSSNDPSTELAIASDELRKIARMRLARLVSG